MATMLRHTPTGDLYPYNSDLARRDDMVEYVPPPEGSVEKSVEVEEIEEIVAEPVKPALVKKTKKAAPKAAPKAKPASEPVTKELDFGDLSDELDELK